MKIEVIHLSDIHLEDSEQAHSIDISKILSALNSTIDGEECIIVISGDLTSKGEKSEYKCVKSFVGALIKYLIRDKFAGKKIELIYVPGNHDINFCNLNISMDDIIKANSNNTIEELIQSYLSSMKAFFDFSQYYDCFRNDKIVSKKVFSFEEKKMGFVLLNTAPLSLMGGNSVDMGNHYLSDEQMNMVESATEAEINILVMHHSIEWFKSSCKDRLRKIISKNYSIVLSGHEHAPFGQSNSVNGYGNVQWVQGNAMQGYAEEGNGFCGLSIDLDNADVIAYSYIWENSLYVPQKIIQRQAKIHIPGEITINENFYKEMSVDGQNRIIDEYYVFPGVVYNQIEDDENLQRIDIDFENDFLDSLSKHSKVIVTGEHKSGKSILAKRIFKYLLNKGKYPLLIESSGINKKKIEKTIDYIFAEQYEAENCGYEKFKQLDRQEKIVIIDEADLLPARIMDSLLAFLEQKVGQIIIFSEEKIELNVRKQVVDVMVEDDTLNITIKPFLYNKRKKLIENILRQSGKNSNVEKETRKINDMINMQVKYFNLDPEFVISFVNQYERDANFQFTAGMNVFNIVYESTIKNQIISNAGNIDAAHVVNILRELAYYMHFGKKSSVTLEEISRVIDKYQKEYRQHVNIRLFLDAVFNAKILIDNGNEIRFKDHTIVAYFVAQAINQKNNQDEDIRENIEDLLRNLCFSINSDIVLFLALITNNPKFVNIIIDGAKKHFDNQEELSFDTKNISFIMNSAIPVKDTLPNNEEREQREKEITKQEETVKLSDLIELVNEYDYTDDDLKKLENQVMISFKYLEIMSKTLPAFCQNMKVDQQDRLVELVYRCPNQFLYMMLKDIGDNFEEFCEGIYDEISLLRKEKNIAEVNIQSVKHMIEQISVVLIIALCQLVASTCTSEQSIIALNDFGFQDNSNYKLQNFMMNARLDDILSFSRSAKVLDKEMESKLSKSIIKFTVRDYFLRNNVEIYGEAQSLLDTFFSGDIAKNIKSEIAKRRIHENDRT